jgi:hypothetical protein
LLVACALVLLAAFGGLFFWNDQYGSGLPVWALLYTISERRGIGTSLLALATSALLPFVSGHHRSGATTFFTDTAQVAEGYWP